MSQPPAPDPVAPGRYQPSGHPDTDVRLDSRQFIFDLISGLLLAGFCSLASAYQSEGPLLALGLTLPWIIRRRYPAVALAISAVSALAQVALLSQPTPSVIAVPMLIYSLARWSDRRLARTALGIALAGSVLGPTRWMILQFPLGIGMLTSAAMTALACAGIVSLAYVIGVRRREGMDRARQEAAAEHERQRLLLAEREQRSRAETVDERNRIARELHDIVAHSLSVIVVQAEGGRALAAKKPEKGPEVLTTIAETSREALEEMRQMVGLLRSGGSAAGSDDAYLPTPGLPDLEDLVAKTGDRVRITVNGPQPAVGRSVGLTVYRVVQESLTNFLKHAGPSAQAEVTVTYSADGIWIRVADNGRGSSAGGDGQGHGLRGMRERVALHHGTLTAHPLSSGGFEVLCWLPYGPRSEPQAPATAVPEPTVRLPQPRPTPPEYRL